MSEIIVSETGIAENKRMDFDNPISIYSYGSEVLANYERLKEDLPSKFSFSDYKDYKFVDSIKVINDFNDSLSGEESRAKKTLKNNKLASGIFNAINRLTKGNVDILGVNDTYEKDLKDYLAAVRDLCQQMSNDANSLKEDSKEFMAFREYVMNIINELDEILVVGWQDVDSFEQSLDELKTEKIEEYKVKLMYIDLAKDRLTSLETSKTLMRSLVSQIDLANYSAAKQIVKYSEFLSITSTTIAVYAKLAARIKRDSKRISRLEETKETVNNTIYASADKLTENVERVAAIGSDSIITKETLLHSAEQFRQGAEIFASYQREKSSVRNGVLATLRQIDETFDKYKNLLYSGVVALEDEDVNLLDGTSKIKRLGTR